jgi:integrase/recombinase XerC
MAWERDMSAGTSMQTAVQRYLDERRRLGFDLRLAGGSLMRFARYADARRHRGPLTLALQIGWAQEHVRRTSPITWARRLEVVRPFAAYYQQFEPETVVPDLYTFGRGHRRLTPHIYSEKEIVDLIGAAGGLNPSGGLRPATYQALFGLIAAAGLRLSEALQIKDKDVDLRAGALTIRQTKFHKSRCLPLHPTVAEVLRTYRFKRDRAIGDKSEGSFFVSPAGDALPKRTVNHVFERLREHLGWVARGGHPNPRIQDLRHTFAVRCVQKWHESGSSIEHGLFFLCTYLGHAKISDTYWYLTGTPDLMGVVGETFERFVKGVDHA